MAIPRRLPLLDWYDIAGDSDVIEIVWCAYETLELRPVIEVDAPCIVVGDLHGDFDALAKVVRLWISRFSSYNMLFLGDYVDRGPRQVEVATAVAHLRSLYPDKVYLLRGNHEAVTPTLSYGFRDQLEELYPYRWLDIYKAFTCFFSMLPYAAVIGGRYLAVHGGLPRDVESVKDLEKLSLGIADPDPSVSPTEFEVLWNDPANGIEGHIPGIRGEGSYIWGVDVSKRFLEQSGLRAIIRGHESPRQGVEICHSGLVITVTTSGVYDTRRKILVIDESMDVVAIDIDTGDEHRVELG